MLTKSQEAIIRSLHTAKGRAEHDLCLVEGQKVIDTAGKAVDLVFTRKDSPRFDMLVTTQTPQGIAATAHIPHSTLKDVTALPTIIILDGVQDPGNVGAIFRLCLGFKASLMLIDSADPAGPKVVRSSVGAMFLVPWIRIGRSEAKEIIDSLKRPVYRLEARRDSLEINSKTIGQLPERVAVIAGSEGQGISLDAGDLSLKIPHDSRLESLNVGHALAILLSLRYQK